MMSKINRNACLEPCAAEDGNLVGRDPRRMGAAALTAAGFERMSPMEVIRAKCLDCCAGSSNEVRWCVATDARAGPIAWARTRSGHPQARRRSSWVEPSPLEGPAPLPNDGAVVVCAPTPLPG